MSRRVVITGIGTITPIGSGREGLWAGLRRGESAGRPVTRFDASSFRSQVAAEVNDFDPLDYIGARKARRLDRFSQLSIAAGRQALEDAALKTNGDAGRGVAVYLGSALGGAAFGETEHERFLEGGLRAVTPTLALAVFGGAGATNVAMEFGLKGPSMGNANSCASGAIAVGEAFRLVGAGGADVALAGGIEAPLAPLIFGAFALIRALTTRNDAPQEASRPFDRDRDGFLMAEGGAMFVLEELEHALSRGARPYAEVLGYGATNDAYHMTAPLPSGEEAAQAMRLALAEAEMAPEEIGYLNAHATATPLGDAAEALAVHLAFGEHAERLPVSGYCWRIPTEASERFLWAIFQPGSIGFCPPSSALGDFANSILAGPKACTATRLVRAGRSRSRSPPWRSTVDGCRRPPTWKTPTRTAPWPTCRRTGGISQSTPP